MVAKPTRAWQTVAYCKICQEMFPASDYRDSCWKHQIDPLNDWTQEDTQPIRTYQLDGEYLKMRKGL